MNGSHWVNNTADGKSGLLSCEIMFFFKVLRERQQIRLSFAADKNDREYSQIIGQTTVDSCKLAEGTLATILQRLEMQNHAGSLNINYSCPFPKNVPIKLTNHLYTDTLLPPMKEVKQFKLEANFTGVLEGRKGWFKLYSSVLLGSFKK